MTGWFNQYQKRKRKRKRAKHMASILLQEPGTCYLCAKLNGDYGWKETQEHHIFPGANRKQSEAYGMKAQLCIAHHIDGPHAVHNNYRYMRMLQQDAQKIFEETHSREEFMDIFGRNYLDESEEQKSGQE